MAKFVLKTGRSRPSRLFFSPVFPRGREPRVTIAVLCPVAPTQSTKEGGSSNRGTIRGEGGVKAGQGSLSGIRERGNETKNGYSQRKPGGKE